MLFPPKLSPPTSVLLVPTHRYFDMKNDGEWNAVGLTDELSNNMLTSATEQHLMVLLAFPEITLGQVNVIELLEVANRFAKTHGFSVELIIYTQTSMGSRSFSTPIYSHNPSARRLTVQLMTSEAISGFSTRWHTVLDMFGIQSKLSRRGNGDADLLTLIESGFDKPDLPRISAVVPAGHGQTVVVYFPRNGRRTA